MNQIPERYVKNPDFQELLNREFDRATIAATMEELAEFAFGSIEDAIDIFEKQKTG